MTADQDDCGFTLPPFSVSLQRHSGYWSHPQWDQAVAHAAALGHTNRSEEVPGPVPGRPAKSGTVTPSRPA
jgi:hypothetical protein